MNGWNKIINYYIGREFLVWFGVVFMVDVCNYVDGVRVCYLEVKVWFVVVSVIVDVVVNIM